MIEKSRPNYFDADAIEWIDSMDLFTSKHPDAKPIGCPRCHRLLGATDGQQLMTRPPVLWLDGAGRDYVNDHQIIYTRRRAIIVCECGYRHRWHPPR